MIDKMPSKRCFKRCWIWKVYLWSKSRWFQPKQISEQLWCKRVNSFKFAWSLEPVIPWSARMREFCDLSVKKIWTKCLKFRKRFYRFYSAPYIFYILLGTLINFKEILSMKFYINESILCRLIINGPSDPVYEKFQMLQKKTNSYYPVRLERDSRNFSSSF